MSLNPRAPTIPAPAIDPGLIWYQLPSGAWARAYTEGTRIYLLAPIGDGLPIEKCTGAIMGPLAKPKGRA